MGHSHHLHNNYGEKRDQGNSDHVAQNHAGTDMPKMVTIVRGDLLCIHRRRNWRKEHLGIPECADKQEPEEGSEPQANALILGFHEFIGLAFVLGTLVGIEAGPCNQI